MTQVLLPAPGAKAAKTCGILAIVLSLTCVGIPVALVLGIVALVQHGKAKRLAQTQPDLYQPVPSTGLVTGILGLVLPLLMVPVVGIVSAIAIPAFIGQRDAARAAAVRANLETARQRVEAAVLAQQAKAPGQVPSADVVFQALSADPAILALKNPYAPGTPAVQRGEAGPLGTVRIFGHHQDTAGVQVWSLQLRAMVRAAGQSRDLEAEVLTHTQERVQEKTPDGWEVVTPAEPPPAAPEAPAEPK